MRDDTDVRLFWESHAYCAEGNTGVNFCHFQLRIDGLNDEGDTGSISGGQAIVYGKYESVCCSAWFRGLTAGQHTVSIWVRGAASTCGINVNNFHHTLTVMELLATEGAVGIPPAGPASERLVEGVAAE